MISAGILLAQILSAPHIGYIPSADGRTRPLMGIPGSLLLGPPEDALAAARIGDITVRKLARDLAIDSTTYPAGEGSALISQGESERVIYIYLPQARELLRWQGGHVDRQPILCWPDDVTSLTAMPSGSFRMLAKVENRWVYEEWLGDVRLVSSREFEAGHAALDSAGELWTLTGNELRGPKRTFFIERPLRLSALTHGWMLIESESARWLAHSARPHLAQIPMEDR